MEYDLDEIKDCFIKNKTIKLSKERNNFYLDEFDDCNVFYIFSIFNKYYKFGTTFRLKEIFNEHKNIFSSFEIFIVYVIESNNCNRIEKEFKKLLSSNLTYLEINNFFHFDIIKINNFMNIEYLISIMKMLQTDYNINNKIELQILEKELEISKLKVELEKIKIIDNKYSKMTLIELKNECKKRNIKKYSSLRKNEIIKLLI